MEELFSYIVLGLSRGLAYGLLALGLVLIYKGSRILNLAQPFFGLLGAFLCGWLTANAAFRPFGFSHACHETPGGRARCRAGRR